jgi:hypothetical protein
MTLAAVRPTCFTVGLSKKPFSSLAAFFSSFACTFSSSAAFVFSAASSNLALMIS